MNPEPIEAEEVVKGAQSPEVPPLQQPQTSEDFNAGLETVVQDSNDGLVRAETDAARQRDDIWNRIQSTSDFNSGDVMQRTFDDSIMGMTGQSSADFMGRLRDENTKLAQLQAKFRSAQAQVQDAQGTMGGQIGKFGEIDRQKAVEVGNQAMLVQAMQGNYETARQIALDTARFASEDKRLELDNLIAQYNAISEIVTGQEKQLIDQKKAEAEAEKAALERSQAAIDAAIMSGAATTQEMAQLNSTTVSDEQKQALAQSIVARGTAQDRAMDMEDRALDRRYREAQIANTYDQIQARRDALAAEIGDENIPTYSEGEALAAVDSIQTIDALKSHPGLNSSVGPIPGTRIAVADQLGAKDDFIAEVDRLTKDLTLKNLISAKEQGATFGALSNAELALLSESATKINNWRRGEKNAEGIVIETEYYDASEEDFKRELDKISNYRKLDYVLRGGAPEAVNIVVTDDGHYYAENSDGSLEQLR